MGQLTITLPDELETKVRKHSREGNYDSVSDFVREVILRATSERPTYWERAHLVYLMEIKQRLGEDVNEELLDALRDGYPKHYSLLDNHILRDELADEEVEFVHNVLQMYADLQSSYNQSKKKDLNIKKNISFPGFDGNAGDGHLGYLSFLVKHGRYTYVKPLDKGDAINSHMTITSMYERMLSKYNQIKRGVFDREPLTLDQISTIIKEQIHPEHRSN